LKEFYAKPENFVIVLVDVCVPGGSSTSCTERKRSPVEIGEERAAAHLRGFTAKMRPHGPV
jgi:hypothetical protein